MTTYLYHDYVATLSERFKASLVSIETGQNFEYGPEFELVMCETLRSAIPTRFGISRGYVVNAEGKRAGDDILIYEQIRFPTLGLREKDFYARKEFIPIESVYCYIEAKHTLHLEGDDNDSQSLLHACNQVTRVKELCNERKNVEVNSIGHHMRLDPKWFTTKVPPGFPPNTLNPMLGVVFARDVKRKKGQAILKDSQEIIDLLMETKLIQKLSVGHPPDIFVLGANCVVLPILNPDENPKKKMLAAFYIPNQTQFHVHQVQGVAFGIGFAAIMAALDWIQLGNMPWTEIIADGLNK